MVDMPKAIDEQKSVGLQIAEIRQAFDQSFAAAVSFADESVDLVLAVRAGADQYAVRLSEIAGVHECPKIVPLIGVNPACIGLVGLRGRLHGVFRLRTLLGSQTTQTETTQTRWLIVASGPNAPAFAVESIDACIAINNDEIRTVEQTDETSHSVRALLFRDGVARELLHIPSLVALVTNNAERGAS